MTKPANYGTAFATPGKADLILFYCQLRQSHPHHLLPLETELPVELRPESRDAYRIIMTMILYQMTDDYRRSVFLSKLFSVYPDMSSWVSLDSRNEAEAVLKKLGFQVDGPGEYSVNRLWCLVKLYFDKWNQTIKPENIETLRVERAYGSSTMRKLYTYWLGRQNLLPLDGKANAMLKEHGLYDLYMDINEVRADIEAKLGNEMTISLINFNEMLSFKQQARVRARIRQTKKIIIGWKCLEATLFQQSRVDNQRLEMDFSESSQG